VKVVVWAGWSTTGRPWILAEKKKGRAWDSSIQCFRRRIFKFSSRSKLCWLKLVRLQKLSVHSYWRIQEYFSCNLQRPLRWCWGCAGETATRIFPSKKCSNSNQTLWPSATLKRPVRRRGQRL
jgi:hypothetical protein